jgi:hypothetical protein
MDYNAILTPGDVAGGIITTVVEIPKGSSLRPNTIETTKYLF